MAKKKSPWLADAAIGATGETYELRTVSDFLKVPEDRRYVCLREFHAWLYMQRAVADLICASAASLGETLPRECIHVRNGDVFRWMDDGKAAINVTIEAPDEQQASDARFTPAAKGTPIGSATESSSCSSLRSPCPPIGGAPR